MEDNKEYAVIAENINKCYKMYSSQKQKFLDLILPKGAGKTFYAIKDMSFKVEKGDSVGLLGLNGAGKSTLSNMLGGTSLPNSGKLIINGESALIAIGLGMNNFLTGIENIELKAIMMGYKKDEIEKIKQEVIEFADIGDFINQPVRTYSSGMRSRLGFGISIHTNPDILVIDEALSVGDPTFAQKCLDKMNEFRESGKTIFFVSHSIPQVKQFCNKAMWLEYGGLRAYGDVEEILPQYQEYINLMNKMTPEEKADYKRSVLMQQEHSLLEEFKLVDPNLKKVTPEGYLIKAVKLINKKLKVKNVPYKFDFYTFAFGGLPSILRGKPDAGLLILAIEALNFFIVPMPISILTNFGITFVAAIMSGKVYVDHLIDKKGYIPLDIWTKTEQAMYLNKTEREKIKSRFTRKRIKNNLALILSIIFIASSIVLAGFIQYRPEIEEVVAENTQAMKIKNLVIINTSKNGDKIRINNIALVNTDAINSELNGVVYPGGLQVKTEGGHNELRNVANINDMEGFKKILSDNLGITMEDYIIIDSSMYKKEDPTLTAYYKANCDEFLNLDETESLKYMKNIENSKMSFEKESVKQFYDEYKEKPDKVKFTTIKYQEVPLIELVTKDILQEINLYDQLKEYDLLVLDRRDIQDSILVRRINEEYEKKIKSKEEETNSDNIENSTSNVNNINNAPSRPSWNTNNGGNNSGGGNTSGGSSSSGGGSTSGGGNTSSGGSSSGGSSSSGGESTSGGESSSGGGNTSGGGSTSGGGNTPGGGSTSGGGDTPLDPVEPPAVNPDNNSGSTT